LFSRGNFDLRYEVKLVLDKEVTKIVDTTLNPVKST
jgi:hypothetical protein